MKYSTCSIFFSLTCTHRSNPVHFLLLLSELCVASAGRYDWWKKEEIGDSRRVSGSCNLYTDLTLCQPILMQYSSSGSGQLGYR